VKFVAIMQGQIALQEKVFERFRRPTATLTKGLHINVRSAAKAKHRA